MATATHVEAPSGPGLYGMIAEFDDSEALLAAVRRTREEGYRNMDAYTPFPVHGMAEALEFEDNRLPWLIFLGGLGGAAGGYALQYYINVIDLPLNIGGKPLHAWPNFIPATFETTILLASFAAVFGMLFLNGFPRPHHPIFNAKRIELASQDKFFLCVEADDPRFDARGTRLFLERLPGVRHVSEVEDGDD